MIRTDFIVFVPALRALPVTVQAPLFEAAVTPLMLGATYAADVRDELEMLTVAWSKPAGRLPVTTKADLRSDGSTGR